MGLSYLHDGHFSLALDAWQRAWTEGKTATEPSARALVDRTVGELARLNASFGHTEQLTALFDDIGTRPITGSATEAIQEAREQLVMANKGDPSHLFICGPLALRSLMLAEGADAKTLNFLQFYKAGVNGTSLAEVARLADQAKLKHQLVLRKPGQPVPIPSVVHWKVGHFATILGKANGRYHVQDAVFAATDIWVTEEALDAEASGYFLVPGADAYSEAWQSVSLAEAETVRGKGETIKTRTGDAGDINANGSSSSPEKHCPLCSYNIKESSVAVSLSDVPVGYTPPIGPSVKVSVSYDQREDSQPANFSFFNVSPKWTLNWQSYLIDDPTNPGASVSRFLAGGGAFYYLGYNGTTKSFAAQDDDGSILAMSAQSPVSYRRQLRDGTVEVYSQSDNSPAYPRRVFLSQILDPQGNAATLSYDSQLRLTSITDAVGRNTTFTYGASGQPLLVTRITDPFGRSARLTYDTTGRLSSITDIIGLTSSFTYDANSLVDSMTTPYGTTSFSYTTPSTIKPRYVQVTDPLGYKEREEWLEPAPIPASDPAATVPTGMPVSPENAYLTFRNSFHWDKHAYVAAGCTDAGGCDYTKARVTHFVHMPGSSIKGTAIESRKNALENRVWFSYPGQTDAAGSQYGGTFSRPIAVGRVLDDGTTQISRFSYDPSNFYNLTQSIDPVGRTTSYAYSNGIDLVAISQKDQSGVSSVLGQYLYNTRHRPLFRTDAAGQVSAYTYNTAGQVTSFKNPLGQLTTYQYDDDANLSSVVNANNAMAESFTYDHFSRIRTYTDSEGWSVTYDYDAADRITKITYPDGTADLYSYDKLDLASYQDREGRRWRYGHDANRRLTKVTDPLGNQIALGYNEMGQVTTLIDAKSNVTHWAYDTQGRLTSKTYADASAVTYTYEATTSRLKSVLDALGQTKQYSYANDDRPLGISYLNAVNSTPNVSFTYDPLYSRLSSMTDGVGTTAYTYYPVPSDGALQLQTECFKATGSSSCSSEIDYAYDALGRLKSKSIAGAGPETFAYDAIGRLTGHSSDLGAFSLSYLGQTSQLQARQLLPVGSTLATSWTYLDNAHDRRLAAINNTGLAAVQFTNFAFTTSPENLITGITQASDEPVSPTVPLPQAASFNNLNQIAALNDQAYSYDDNGNLLSDGERSYSWDAEDRLVKITYPSQSGKQTEFTYDGLGRRVIIATTPAGGGDSTTTNYLWCGDRICQSRGSGGLTQRSYFDEGEFLFGSTGQPLFYGVDQIGSVRRVFASATNAPSYDYDPYGVPLQATPATTDFGFAGMMNGPDSGLGLTWYRAYDPALGRWNSRDPLGEDPTQAANRYTYANNSPLINVDPTGKMFLHWPVTFPAPQPAPEPDFCPAPDNIPGFSGPLLSKPGQITPDAGELEGKTSDEINQELSGRGWPSRPAKNGQGTAYDNPDRKGETVRVHPNGTKNTSSPDLHEEPYGTVSKGGSTRRFFLGK